MNTPLVSVYLMTRNRPETVIDAVDSILSQTFNQMELIVSDNSTDDRTTTVLSSYGNRLKYIKRNPTFDSGIDHINAIIEEVSSDYFMIFHDDDQMLPNMVKSLYDAITSNNSVCAAASNAWIVKGERMSIYFPRCNAFINCCDEMIDRYSNGLSAPFPSYMYKTHAVKGLYLNVKHGHKYSDVSFIADVSCRGPVVFVGEPLMKYNIHPEQDSQTLDYLGHVKLTNYLRRIVSDKKVITGLRIYHIYSNSVEGFKEGNMHCNMRIVSLLFKYSIYNYFPKYIIRFIQSKFHA